MKNREILIKDSGILSNMPACYIPHVMDGQIVKGITTMTYEDPFKHPAVRNFIRELKNDYRTIKHYRDLSSFDDLDTSEQDELIALVIAASDDSCKTECILNHEDNLYLMQLFTESLYKNNQESNQSFLREIKKQARDIYRDGANRMIKEVCSDIETDKMESFGYAQRQDAQTGEYLWI